MNYPNESVTLDDVQQELTRARNKFPNINSAHEGYAVVLEELDEAWDEVKANNPEHLRHELIHVAAMAVRTIEDLDLQRPRGPVTASDVSPAVLRAQGAFREQGLCGAFVSPTSVCARIGGHPGGHV